MTSLYERLLAREEWLKSKGYSLVSMWECDFKNQIKNNHKVKRFVGNLDISNHIRGREAFLSGHTNVLHLYYEIKEGEKIEYVDFCSLYPYINKTSRYPVGHPTVVTKDFIAKPTAYFDIIKCDILPPRILYISVLLFRVSNKLMFPLCSKCTETMNQDKCYYGVNERQLTGVWCSPELEKAEEVGYRITKWCRTEEDRTIYIQRYHESEGIVLDRSKITTNLGLKAFAKLNLNSFWGKLGQRSNFGQSTYLETPAKLLEMLMDSTKDVTDLSFVSDEMVLVQHCDKEDYITEALNTNIVLAAMTTSYARLKLYSVLE
ncbi:uncharacterized protein LOC144351911 [Saccoglossus kowalevskii]